MLKIHDGVKPEPLTQNMRKENEMLMDLVLTLTTIRDGYKDKPPKELHYKKNNVQAGLSQDIDTGHQTGEADQDAILALSGFNHASGINGFYPPGQKRFGKAKKYKSIFDTDLFDKQSPKARSSDKNGSFGKGLNHLNHRFQKMNDRVPKKYLVKRGAPSKPKTNPVSNLVLLEKPTEPEPQKSTKEVKSESSGEQEQ
jgi:hypothetical protein